MIDRSSFEFVRIGAYNAVCRGKKPVSRLLRKLVAKTNLHRAWLQGNSGSFLLPVLDRT
jgi:hypothetical protein